MAGLDAEDDLPGFGGPLVEVEAAVDALVAALLVAPGDTCADQPKRPRLELERVLLGEYPSVIDRGRFADGPVRLGDLGAVAVGESMLDEPDG